MSLRCWHRKRGSGRCLIKKDYLRGTFISHSSDDSNYDFLALVETAPGEPTSRQLLVSVRAAGLNQVDFKTRRGDLRLVQRYRLHAVLGNELSVDPSCYFPK